MKRIFNLLTLLLMLSIHAVAQDSIFPKGEKTGTDAHHVGNVWLNEISHADSIFHYNIAVAIFEPAARLNWHSHPGGQILLISEGVGFYQEKGKPKQTVRKGDVIKCAPGIEHWHGATADNGFGYIATSPTDKGRTIWGERVTDEQYNK